MAIRIVGVDIPQNKRGEIASDTIDVCQRNLSSFILRNIYTNYSYSHILYKLLIYHFINPGAT